MEVVRRILQKQELLLHSPVSERSRFCFFIIFMLSEMLRPIKDEKLDTFLLRVYEGITNLLWLKTKK
jgi:hypothetical protein